MSVKWADWTIVECTLNLLEEANKNGPYSFYHLLSGQDLLIKPVNEINKYFDKNLSYNFVEINDGKWAYKNIAERKYHKLFTPYSSFRVFRWIQKAIKKILVISFSTICKYTPYRRGSEWWDINQNLVTLIIDDKRWIKNKFSNFYCADEAFIQTIVAKHNLENNNKGLMHLADWNRSENGHPYTFRIDDYDMIMKSECFFARKFDCNMDGDIIDKICENV